MSDKQDTEQKVAGRMEVLSAGLIDRGIVQADDAEGAGFDPVAAALEAIDAGAAELQDVKRSLTAQKGQTTRARAAVEAAKPPKPRKFGPIEDRLSPAELAELVADAEDVEIAFVDRKGAEIGIAPRRIEGDAFRATVEQFRLNVPSLLIHGPEHGRPAWPLAGYVLLLDGEPVAASARDEVLIAAGQKVELGGDVVF